MTTIHHPRITATALSLATLCVAAGCTDHAPIDDLAADPPHASSSGTTATTSTSTHDSDTSEPSASDTSEPSPMTTSETGATSECSPDHTCVPAVDSGWAGPMVAREGDSGELELSCESPFAEHFATLHAGLVAPPATCTCECEAEGTPGCEPVSQLEQFEANVCAGPYDDWFVSSDCNSAVAAAPGTSLSADEIEVTGVACEPSPTEFVPPATFARTIMMCMPPSAPVEACGDAGECAPTFDPRVEQLCIAREGDEPCPAAWDGQRHVYHRELEDDRECSDCSCTEFSGTCSGVTIVVFGSNDCSGTPVGGVTPGTCDQLGNQGASSGRRSGVGVPDVDCSGNAVGGDPIGSAEATTPFTVCCLLQ